MFSQEQSSPQSHLVDPPSSPSRTRLRSLNYLRTHRQSNTSHTHGQTTTSHGASQVRPLESREGRSTSYIPSPRLGDSPKTPQTPRTPRTPTRPTPKSSQSESNIAREFPAQISNHDKSGTTSGWLPTVGGQSGVSRIASEPQATATASSSALLSHNNTTVKSSEIPYVMPRAHRSSIGDSTLGMPHQSTGENNTFSADRIIPSSANRLNNQAITQQLPSIRFSAHQDPRAQRPSLVFTPMLRILPSGKEVIKVGRYSEKDCQPVQASNMPSSAPIGFKSKVVSRRHCEFWCYAGSWFIKDVKSSSGTFLNHIRLSPPGTESKPFPVHDGDIVQLGIDFKGGEEMIFRCVKIKLELNKGWQTGPSSFNMKSHKQLCELNGSGRITTSRASQDCSICLGPIAPCQPLFVAPCSHTWHYKCIRVIINGPHWPHFICPNCRNIADLEAELEDIGTGELEEIIVEKNLDEYHNVADPSININESLDEASNLNVLSRGIHSDVVESPGVRNRAAIVNMENTSEISEDSDHQKSNNSQYRLDHFHSDLSSDSLTHSLENTENLAVPMSTTSRTSSVVCRTGCSPIPMSTTSCTSSVVCRTGCSPIPMSTTSRTSSVICRSGCSSPRGLEITGLDSARSIEVVNTSDLPLTPTNNLGPYVFDGNDGGIATINTSSMDLATEIIPRASTPDSAK